MKTILLGLGLLMAMALPAQQVSKGLTASNGVFIGFLEYKPTDYNPNTKYPLIIFLHGIGERGNGTTDLPNVANNGVPSNIKNGHTMKFTWNGKTETFLVLSPQLSNSYGSWQNFYVDEMLNYAKKNLSIDTNRIILTGLSLGGGGTWYYAGSSLANAKKFAAVGVSCGTCQGISWCNFASANLPVWAFHATNDGTVSASCTNNAITNINNCSPTVKPYKTIWPDGDHWIWGRVYDTDYNWQNPNIFEWFIAQDKSKPVNKRPVAVAGSAQNVTTTGGAATLNGSQSTDQDGKIVRYVWRNISGPVSVGMSNAVSTNGIASVTGLSTAGTYTFELKAIDDRADWTLDTMQVNVTNGTGVNQPPVVNAGSNVTITLPTNTVALNGSATDPDGVVGAYEWSKVSGPDTYTLTNNKSANATLSNLVEGVYVFNLRAWDNLWLPGDARITITVKAAAGSKPPVVSAGSTATITLPANTASLNGTATAGTNAISTYNWSKVAGPTQHAIANASVAVTSVSNLVQGTYRFCLKVTDNTGLSATDTTTIIVNAAPVAPTVSAGAGSTITLPANTASLNGIAAAGTNAISTYNWSKVAGPTQYTIANANVAATSVSNLVQGTYRFCLKVTDNAGLFATDTTTIVVNAAPVTVPPVANAGGAILITLPANSATLNGSATAGTNSIASYSWTKVSGPAQYTIANTNAALTSVSNLVQGTYNFRLQVTDSKGLTAADSMILVVNPATVTKTSGVNAGDNVTITLPANSVTLDGSSSYDPNGKINAFKWTKISGPDQYTIETPTAAITKVSRLVAGVYKFQLGMWDSKWYPTNDTVTVTVKGAAVSVTTVTTGSDVTITLPTSTTMLSGVATPATGATISSYKWTKISGPSQYTITNSAVATTSVSNLVQGTYKFSLLVTDSKGATAADTTTVVVNAPANQYAVVKPGPNVTITLPVNSVTLDGSASYDPDGKISAYEWIRLSGPAQYNITSSRAATTTVTGLVQGRYVFRLTVWDNEWYPTGDTVVVTVNAATNAAAKVTDTINTVPAVTVDAKDAVEVKAKATATEQVTVGTGSVQVYPNPATNTIQMVCNSIATGRTQVTFYDMTGKATWKHVFTKNSTVTQLPVDISKLTQGVYNVDVNIDNKTRLSARFIKQ